MILCPSFINILLYFVVGPDLEAVDFALEKWNCDNTEPPVPLHYGPDATGKIVPMEQVVEKGPEVQVVVEEVKESPDAEPVNEASAAADGLAGIPQATEESSEVSEPASQDIALLDSAFDDFGDIETHDPTRLRVEVVNARAKQQELRHVGEKIKIFNFATVGSEILIL